MDRAYATNDRKFEHGNISSGVLARDYGGETGEDTSTRLSGGTRFEGHALARKVRD